MLDSVVQAVLALPAPLVAVPAPQVAAGSQQMAQPHVPSNGTPLLAAQTARKTWCALVTEMFAGLLASWL